MWKSRIDPSISLKRPSFNTTSPSALKRSTPSSLIRASGRLDSRPTTHPSIYMAMNSSLTPLTSYSLICGGVFPYQRHCSWSQDRVALSALQFTMPLWTCLSLISASEQGHCTRTTSTRWNARYHRDILENFKTMRHPPLRDILTGFEGVIRPGEMLRP